jgi:hypothetical protein
LLESNSATNVHSMTFDVREVMARFALQDIGRTSDKVRKRGILFERATPKVKRREIDVRLLYVRLETKC